MFISSGNDSVDQLGQMNITGVVTPHNWFKVIQKSGKPYLPAIMILSEIVYWYRPTEERDEMTGALIGYKKRFKADLLQKSTNGFVESFGLTNDQVNVALKHLKDMGVISIHLRTITVNGKKMNNVRYIDLHVDVLKKLTYPIVHKLEGSSMDTIGLSYRNDTNTKITGTKITNTLKDNAQKDLSANELESSFNEFWNLYDKKTGKKKCFDKYKKLLKEYEHQTIIDGVKSYNNFMYAKGTDKQYKKDPLTFLNGEHFNDEFTPGAKVNIGTHNHQNNIDWSNA